MIARLSAALFTGTICVIAGSANAQSFGNPPRPAAIDPAPIYMPFVWQGNRLDQNMLDAQAQMSPRPGPPHQSARHHHARRQHS